MESKKPDKKDIISLAEKTKRYCDLLIEQSDNWLSEEEGVKNVEKRLDKPSESKKKIKKILGGKGAKVIIGILLSFSFSSITFGQDVDSLFTVFTQSEDNFKNYHYCYVNRRMSFSRHCESLLEAIQKR